MLDHIKDLGFYYATKAGITISIDDLIVPPEERDGAADLGGGKNLCFVKVETDGGPHGWGECYTQADRDTSIVALVEAIGRYLVGRDASHITHFVHWAYHDWAAKRGAKGSPVFTARTISALSTPTPINATTRLTPSTNVSTSRAR